MSIESPEDISQQEARRLLGQIRQGVPPDPDKIPLIRVGRKDEENKIVSDPVDGLESVSDGNGHIFFVLGDYGFGKSFFLNLIALRASERNLLWSMPEIPDIGTLSNKTKFCTEIISNIRYPDSSGNGSAPLLRRFCEEMSKDEFEEMAVRRNLVGGPCYKIFKQVLTASKEGGLHVEHYKGEEHVDFADVLAGAATYMHGGQPSLSQLWAIGKNGHSHISKEDEYEYLKGLRSLALELGREGFVVLIDEFAEEEMSWNPDEDTEKRLIDLVNKCYQENEFTNMMFVFVGNRLKWNDLIESAGNNTGGGHEALRHRYDAGKLELETLNEDDYADLVNRVGKIVEIGYGTKLSLPSSGCRAIVDEAVSKYDTIENLSPRRLLLNPLKQDKSLVELLRERYENEDDDGDEVF